MSSAARTLGSVEEFRLRAVSRGGGALISALLATCRFRVSGEENFRQFWHANQPVVFVLWHGRLLAGAYHQRGNGLAALISHHRDGEYIARVVERWGYRTVRGSSTRGGSAALRGLLRELRQGHSVVLTPDGPQGPRQRMKAGALLVAQMSGAPIVPVATGADRSWWIEGWDRFQIPKPFSRIRIAYGLPVQLSQRSDEQELERRALELERDLNALLHDVDQSI